MKPSKTKLKNFRAKIKELGDQELEIRASMKRLYAQLILDADDDRVGLRHVQQAYFQIQKYRIFKMMQERLEFHPFFGASNIDYLSQYDDDDDDDDDEII